MATLQWPAQGRPLNIEYGLTFPAQRNRSGFTGRSRVIGLPGAQLWTFKVDWTPVVTETQNRVWRAFTAGMRGLVNVSAFMPLKSLYMSPTAVQKTGLAASYTVAASIAVDTLQLNTVAGLEVGMFGSFIMGSHSRLFIITAINASNITISPDAHQPPTVGLGVEFKRPYANVRFQDPRSTWSDGEGKGTFALNLEEAI